MDLGEYVRAVRRYWKSILVCTLLGVILGSSAALIAAPTYTARAQLFVAIQGSASVSELQQGNSFTQARVQSYVRTVSTPVVLQPVIDALGLNVSPEQLSKSVTASSDAATVLISISVSDSSPVQAAAIATAIADSLITAVDGLERPSPDESSPVRLSIIAPPTAPSSPSAPSVPLYIALGLVLGLLGGAGTAIARRTLDNKVRGEAELRAITAAPLLGGIPYDPEALKKPLITQTHTQSPRAEVFRQIRTNLQFANINSKSKTILITSSLPGEGKSTTATNMAIALAQAGHRTVLIDADLRRPMVAKYLGLEGGAGLTTALLGAASVDDLLQPWGEDQLYVLTSGQIPPNPSELLGSERMAAMIAELESIFDFVIIDAPPLIPVTDASVLSQKVGGVVLVAASGRIKTQDLSKAFASLQLVNAEILGVVLNLLPTKGPDAYSYSYYSYESHDQAGRESKTSLPKGGNGSHMKAGRRMKMSNTSF